MHDGDRPDLVPELVSDCAMVCSDDGVLSVSVRVKNPGSATIAEAIPSLTASASVVIEVPSGELGTVQVLQVNGADLREECDRVNDRVEVDLSICSP